MIDYKDIKIKNKYLLFRFSKSNDKSILITKSNTKSELNEKLKTKKIKETDDIMLMKIGKTKWTPDIKIPINMLGGPIKITFLFYTVTKRLKLKKIEDPRAVQFLFYTLDYYSKNKFKADDLKKLALISFKNKLEKRPLAPKLITQINKL